MNLLRALAARATPPVFVVAGDGGYARARKLRLDPRLRAVASPRHATILLVIGRIPPALEAEATAVHDQLPAPRAVVVWSDVAPTVPDWNAMPRVADHDDPVPTVTAVHRDVVRGSRRSTDILGPTINPRPWQGVGPHGQGGEGMMGGHPYGRAMAMTGEDVRDGLQLDRLCVPLGPFLPFMPPGLRLEAVLQGDVFVDLTVRRVPCTRPDRPPVFERAATEAVAIAELEQARAVHLVEVTSQLLLLHGLGALAVRLARTVHRGDPDQLERLVRRLGRLGLLRGATRGIGPVAADLVGNSGPNARAAGCRDDARSRDPAYRELDFTPIVANEHSGDAWNRCRQRLAEAVQALTMARRAQTTMREPGPELETPRGRLDARVDWTRVLPELAIGRSFDAFMTTLVSLDLDCPLDHTLDRTEEHASCRT